MNREINNLLNHVMVRADCTVRLDLEAIEMATRRAMHRVGAKLLSDLLQEDPPTRKEIPCSCGHFASFREMRVRNIHTVLGPIQLLRAYFLCSKCNRGQSPRDVELDIVNVLYSPGVRRMVAVVGSDFAFEKGREQLELLAGLDISTKAVERQAEAIGADIFIREKEATSRIMNDETPPVVPCKAPVIYIEMDGTGIPVVPSEVDGRKGKIDGERARTREVKLGCVFTQTKIDQKGRPVRDEGSTTYVGAIETAEEFGPRIYAEAYMRGYESVKKAVVIGDGAPWIWNLSAEHFPTATQIVDLYHAQQHIWELATKLYPIAKSQKKRWSKRMLSKLKRGRINALVADLRSIVVSDKELSESVRIEADYFERNASRMRYPSYKRQKLFVGSGVIEAGCKSVAGSRLKCSGMFWTVRGANAILALRTARISNRFENYWESRQLAA